MHREGEVLIAHSIIDREFLRNLPRVLRVERKGRPADSNWVGRLHALADTVGIAEEEVGEIIVNARTYTGFCRRSAGKIECTARISLLRLEVVDCGMNIFPAVTHRMLPAGVTHVHIARVLVVPEQEWTGRGGVAESREVGDIHSWDSTVQELAVIVCSRNPQNLSAVV